MSSPLFSLEYPDAEALRADLQSNLRKRRAFVPGHASATELQPCRLLLIHPDTGAHLELGAEVVWVKRDAPGEGVGLELEALDEPALERLERFVQGGDAGRPGSLAVEPLGAADPPRSTHPSASPLTPPAASGDPIAEGATDDPESHYHPSHGPASHAPRNLHEKVRQLVPADRESLARTGGLPERVAVERAFGSTVWEGLLHNPHLTAPEIAKIAKSGALAPNLLGLILQNRAWLAKPEVRAALLSNPRLGASQATRILQAASPAELAAITQNPSYGQQVRTAAKRLVKK